MQQIIIHLQNKGKAYWLADFLRNLNFISSIETIMSPSKPSSTLNHNRGKNETLFKSLRGCLKNTSFTSAKFQRNKQEDKMLER